MKKILILSVISLILGGCGQQGIVNVVNFYTKKKFSPFLVDKDHYDEKDLNCKQSKLYLKYAKDNYKKFWKKYDYYEDHIYFKVLLTKQDGRKLMFNSKWSDAKFMNSQLRRAKRVYQKFWDEKVKLGKCK